MPSEQIERTSASSLIDETEAAKRLGLSVKTLRRWRWSGHGPLTYVKLGRVVRYDSTEIEECIRRNRRWSTSEAAVR